MKTFATFLIITMSVIVTDTTFAAPEPRVSCSVIYDSGVEATIVSLGSASWVQHDHEEYRVTAFLTASPGGLHMAIYAVQDGERLAFFGGNVNEGSSQTLVVGKISLLCEYRNSTL